MKKFLTTIFVLVLTSALVFITGIVYSYYTAEETLVPQTKITVAGETILPDSYNYRVSLMNGLTHRDFKKPSSGSKVALGEVNGKKLPVVLPTGYNAEITVVAEKDEKDPIFEGSGEEYQNFSFAESGNYRLAIKLTSPETKGENYGNYNYEADVTVALPINLLYSKTEVVQGDVFAIAIENVPEGESPTVETEISQVTFAKVGEKQVAYIPISYTRDPGEYRVMVRCGDFSREVVLQVTDGTFEEQYMKINTSNPVISEANSPAAYQEYRDAIYPLYEQADPQIYWTGKFIQPLEKYRLTTSYGIKRFTNGSKKATRHAGVDMAAATGTPVKAPGAGRVVFAKRLLNTGNTIAIEHGAGLKTFYFHMDSLNITVGQMVEQGQLIGTVGTTGYSTGPHLHFEMRMANQAIDPGYLMNGAGGFYWLPQ